MRPRAILLTILVFMLSSFSLAEDPFILLEKTLDKYMNTPEYSFNYRMSWYCEGKKGNGTVNGTYIKKGNNFMLQQGEGRTIQADGYLLNINDKDKVIILQRMQKATTSSELFEMMKMEKEFVSGSLVTTEEGNKITFTSNENSPLSYVSSSEILLNLSGWIKYSVFNYDTREQGEFDQKCTSLRLDYVAYKFENVDARPLRLSNYVIIEGKQANPSSAYKNYEIISSLNVETE